MSEIVSPLPERRRRRQEMSEIVSPLLDDLMPQSVRGLYHRIQFIFCEIWTLLIFVYSFSRFCRYGCELVSSERVFVMTLSSTFYIFEIFRFVNHCDCSKNHVMSNYVKERLVLTTIQDQSP